MANTPLSSQFISAAFFISVTLAGMSAIMFRLGGQPQLQEVLELPSVSGELLRNGRWAPGTEVKLSARIVPGHESVLEGTELVIAERDTITTTADQDDYRVKERDLAASHLPSLDLVAIDGHAFRIAPGARVLAGSTTHALPYEEGTWRTVFHGFMDNDLVGLRGTVTTGSEPLTLDQVWLVSGSVEDLDAHYADRVRSSENLGRWMLQASMGSGLLWLLLVTMRYAWRSWRGST